MEHIKINQAIECMDATHLLLTTILATSNDIEEGFKISEEDIFLLIKLAAEKVDLSMALISEAMHKYT
jgi:hypothetical protein